MKRWSKLATGAAALALSVATAGTASADPTKQDCDAAYRQTQIARKGGKLLDAATQALVCGASSCPGSVKTDCIQWYAEITASTPTVVFSVEDAGGNDTAAVRVTVDGRVRLERLTGAALPLDPGPHTIVLEVAGGAPIEQKVLLSEGEKNRRVVASLRALGTSSPPPVVVPVAPTPVVPVVPPPVVPVAGPPMAPVTEVPAASSERSSRRAAGFALGGVGVAGVLVGAVTGGLMLSKKSTVTSNCTGPTNGVWSCANGTGVDAGNSAKTLGTVSNIGWVVGAAGLVSGIVLLATAPRADRADRAERPTARGSWSLTVSAAGPAATIGGSFQ